MLTSRKLTMPTQPTHQDITTSFIEGLKSIRRRTPIRHQGSVPEMQLEPGNQDTKSEADFTSIATKTNEINFTNMPTSMQSYIVQKLTPMQVTENHRLQPQQISENSTKSADVLNDSEFDDVLDNVETTQKSLEMQQPQVISEINPELQNLPPETPIQQTFHSELIMPAVTANSDWTLDTTRDRDGPAQRRVEIPSPNPDSTSHLPFQKSNPPALSANPTTTTPSNTLEEQNTRTHPTDKNKEFYLQLQQISPPHALWILYKAIEGDLIAARYTRTEILDYISDLKRCLIPQQTESPPSRPRPPDECYVAPRGHFYKEPTALTRLDPPKKSSVMPWKAKKKMQHSTPSRTKQLFIYKQTEPITQPD
jgi:hypothetical protein